MDPPISPRLRTQHEPLQPNMAYPHFGRDELDHAHAVYSIARSLEQLGLADWLPVIVRWLGHYDGIERWLEDEFDPAIAVRQTLVRHAATQGHADSTLSCAQAGALKQAIVEDLLELDFVRYRADWGPYPKGRLRWDPLHQSWLSFLTLGEASENLSLWPSEQNSAYRQELAVFLLMGPTGA